MSNNSRFSPFFLIESYLRKDLSPEEAANLLSEIRQNPAIFDLLRENIAADIWLEEFFSAKKDLLVSSDDLSHNSFDLTGDFEEQLTSFKRKNFPSDGILNNSEPEFPAEESLRTTIYIPPREDSPEPSPWKEWFTNKKSSKKKKESSLLLSWQKSNIPLIVLLCCIGAFLSLLVIHYFRSPNREWDIETATARIAQTIDAEWEPESEEWPKGRRFDQGEIKLKSGLVQIALKNGISLTLEGPVDFALNDLMSSFCNKGKVSVAVPHNAKNYEMLTPFSAIYDRGTEFFVQVSDRETDLTVIKGQVDCLPQKGNLISLKAEEALSVGISQQVKRIAPQKEIYISSGLFAQKLNIFVQKELKKESEKIGASDLRN
ncbi:MAG: FecR domain-containing protein, partial [Planctomycetia bacterium]|nr:FecR domain-containing protein [Planctomycetia bacterium]